MAFAYYKTLTLAAAQAGTADSTNWPLAISLDGSVQAADADLKTTGSGGYVQSSSGFDIRPYADSGLTSALTYELVYYDGANGKLEMHVNIPTLSHSSNTVIYLAFGDAALTTDGSSVSTWNANFKSVLHLKDGSSLTLTDSSTNANDLTNSGATAAAGKVDGGAAMTGSAYAYITNGSNILTDLDTQTVSMWVKGTSFTGLPMVWAIAGTGADMFGEVGDTSGLTILQGYRQSTGGSPYATWNCDLSDAGWHLLHFVKSGATAGQLYRDGAAATLASGSISASPTLANLRFEVGAYSATTTWQGSMDEVRVMNTNISASWATADYNSQKTSSTFIGWSAKVSTSAPAANYLIFRNSNYV